jgi:hypothetical protein
MEKRLRFRNGETVMRMEHGSTGVILAYCYHTYHLVSNTTGKCWKNHDYDIIDFDKPIRNIEELLTIMLVNKHYFVAGLCRLAASIYLHKHITYQEYLMLERYIGANRPSKWSSISAYKNREKGFFWKHGVISYRIKWLEKHIKLNS